MCHPRRLAPVSAFNRPSSADPSTPSLHDALPIYLFVFLDAHRPWRQVKVTEQRTALDFAECMRDLVDIHYPQAEKIRVVLEDRKSTRLNSSHRCISYAVFCLKKKS